MAIRSLLGRINHVAPHFGVLILPSIFNNQQPLLFVDGEFSIDHGDAGLEGYDLAFLLDGEKFLGRVNVDNNVVFIHFIKWRGSFPRAEKIKHENRFSVNTFFHFFLFFIFMEVGTAHALHISFP